MFFCVCVCVSDCFVIVADRFGVGAIGIGAQLQSGKGEV